MNLNLHCAFYSAGWHFHNITRSYYKNITCYKHRILVLHTGVDLAAALSRASHQHGASSPVVTDVLTPRDTNLMSDLHLPPVSNNNKGNSSSSPHASPAKKDAYQCKSCSFYVTSQKAIVSHFRVHGENGIFWCAAFTLNDPTATANIQACFNSCHLKTPFICRNIQTVLFHTEISIM